MQIQNFTVEITRTEDGYTAVIQNLETGDTWIPNPINCTSSSSIYCDFCYAIYELKTFRGGFH